MRKKLYLAAAVLAALFALYAGAGFWLAPRLLERRLVDLAAAAGHDLRIERLRTNPFHLSSSFEGVSLARRDGAPLLTLQRGELSAYLASLWGRNWRVQSVSLEGLRGYLAVAPDGSLNWAEFLGAMPKSERKEPPRVVIESLSIANGALEYADRSRSPPSELRAEPIDLQLRGLSTVADRTGQYVLTAGLVGGGSLKWQGTLSLEPLALDGALELAGLSGEVLGRLTGVGRAFPHGAFHGSARVSFEAQQRELRLAKPRVRAENFSLKAAGTAVTASGVELESDAVRLAFQPLRIEGGALAGKAANVAVEDARLRHPGGLALPSVTLEAEKAAWPASGPIGVSANAQLKPSGRLQASGAFDLQALTGRLGVQAAEIPLALAQPWIADLAAVDVASGVIGLRGTLGLGPGKQGAPRLSYTGAATLANVSLNESKSRQPLIAWKLLDTAELSLRVAPNGAEVGDVLWREPAGRLLIGEDRKVNVAKVKPGEPAPKADSSPEERFPVRVRRVRIESGRLDFSDRSLSPPFAARIDELSGAVSSLSSNRQDAARLELDGRVEKYGAARIRGTINPFAPKELTAVVMNFRNLEMSAFTPYAAKFAGYRIRSGKLSAELRYKVRDGALAGQNHVVIDRLQLGERVESPTALDLPIGLAIALLTDAQGRIELGLPVHGDLNDPQFDFGALVGRVFANVVGKMASAPFRLLGSVFAGREEGFDRIVFDPGSARLLPPEREKIAAIAKALGERPRLALAVHGGFDPQADANALRRAALRRELARRAGYKVDADESVSGIDLRDTRMRNAAGTFFIEQGGTAFQLNKMDGPELFRALADKMPLADGLLQKLARERAEAIQAALLQSGAEAARLTLGDAKESEASKEGVPSMLGVEAKG